MRRKKLWRCLTHRLLPCMQVLRGTGNTTLLPFLILVAALAVGLAGCTSMEVIPLDGPLGDPDTAANQTTGVIRARAVLQTGELDGCRVKTAFIKKGTVVETESSVAGDTISIVSPELWVGTWTIFVTVYDPEGRAIYSGTAEVLVQADVVSAVDITLGPAKGYLIVTMDLSEFANVDGVLKGKLLTNEEVYENFAVEDPLVPVEVSLELAPHDYDIAVALYKDAYYSSDQIYLSPYQHVSIQPGETTRVTWKPPTGTVAVELALDAAPQPPTEASLTRDGSTVLITWLPSPSSDVVTYRVYLRTDDQFTGYQLWEEVSAAGDCQARIDLDLFNGTSVLYAVVTAVDGAGNESSRSNECTLVL